MEINISVHWEVCAKANALFTVTRFIHITHITCNFWVAKLQFFFWIWTFGDWKNEPEKPFQNMTSQNSLFKLIQANPSLHNSMQFLVSFFLSAGYLHEKSRLQKMIQKTESTSIAKIHVKLQIQIEIWIFTLIFAI